MEEMMGDVHTGASWNIADAELYPPNWTPRAKPAAWFGPTADSRKRPRPAHCSSSAPQGFDERVWVLMEVVDPNLKLNQAVKDTYGHSVTGCTLSFTMFHVYRAPAA
jgi:hypothetical protein